MRGCVVAWGVRARAHACVHACVGVHDALGVGLASSAPRLGTPGAVGPALVRSPALVWVKRPDKLVAARVLHARAAHAFMAGPAAGHANRTRQQSRRMRTHARARQPVGEYSGGGRAATAAGQHAAHAPAPRHASESSTHLFRVAVLALGRDHGNDRRRQRAAGEDPRKLHHSRRTGGGGAAAQRRQGAVDCGTRQHGAAPRGGALRAASAGRGGHRPPRTRTPRLPAGCGGAARGAVAPRAPAPPPPEPPPLAHHAGQPDDKAISRPISRPNPLAGGGPESVLHNRRFKNSGSRKVDGKSDIPAFPMFFEWLWGPRRSEPSQQQTCRRPRRRRPRARARRAPTRTSCS